MDGSDVNCTHWNLLLIQKLKEGFKRADRWSLDAHTLTGLVNVLFENIDKVVWDRLLRFFNFLFVLTSEKLGTCHRKLHIRRTDLNTHCALDALVMQVVAFDAHFFHRMRGKQGSNLRDNRAIHARYHNCVANFNRSVDEHDINSSAMAFNHFDFNNCAFEFILFLELFPDFFLGLAHVAKLEHKIWQTLAGNCRGRHKTECIFWRCVFPIEGNV